MSTSATAAHRAATEQRVAATPGRDGRGRGPAVPRLRPGRGPVAPHRLLLGALPAARRLPGPEAPAARPRRQAGRGPEVEGDDAMTTKTRNADPEDGGAGASRGRCLRGSGSEADPGRAALLRRQSPPRALDRGPPAARTGATWSRSGAPPRSCCARPRRPSRSTTTWTARSSASSASCASGRASWSRRSAVRRSPAPRSTWRARPPRLASTTWSGPAGCTSAPGRGGTACPPGAGWAGASSGRRPATGRRSPSGRTSTASGRRRSGCAHVQLECDDALRVHRPLRRAGHRSTTSIRPTPRRRAGRGGRPAPTPTS